VAYNYFGIYLRLCELSIIQLGGAEELYVSSVVLIEVGKAIIQINGCLHSLSEGEGGAAS
jgi:hypothetical protein